MTTAADLDRALGDPTDARCLFSFARLAELDRAEAFPADHCRELDRLGLAAHYVPAEFGGDLRSYPELLELVRVVARRDLTVAVAHGKTFLGTVCVWLAGDRDQATGLAREVRAGIPVSLALTERDHGSDLLAGQVRAAEGRLTGEKWLINNATRSSLVSVLARTSPAGGPRGFSILLADKRTLPEGSYRLLPKVPTHGIRGADISGIEFRDAPAALVGPVGGGLELVFKALQLTRTFCAGLSLGAADQALSQATAFTRSRHLYGRRLIDMPHIRRKLGEAHAARTVAEAVTTVAARSIHTLPGEMAVVSAVAKAFVPARVDELIAGCGTLLGARAFLTEVLDHGAFQKLDRDHRVVAIFDGSSFVNRNALINHFPALVRGYRASKVDEMGLREALDARGPLPPSDPRRLALSSKDGSSLVQSLRDGPGDLTGATELLRACDDLHEKLVRVKPAPRDVPSEAFALAQRYEFCFAGAAVLGLHRVGALATGQATAALAYVLAGLTGRPAKAAYDRLAEEVLND
ncbi:acyl-CoA dehydrogenase family protein [Nonomuraea sp. 10N515B]|uniref:acyl-CoA dehydrogenase family protein n=1 Tax=Nonomuraea sp. 10N515B TaxID=3457422 RepID=UPI003FCE0F97